MTRRVWAVGAERLTPEQMRAVQLDTSANHLILGPAGSGKTLVLLYRAQHLMQRARIPGNRLRVLVFTNVLRAYIQSGFAAVDLPAQVVESFFAWVGALARQLGVRADTDDAQGKYLATLRAVLAQVEQANLPPFLDAVLVDEGQDLPPEAFRLLTRVSRHVTVLADYAQTIYDDGAHISELAQILGVSRECSLLLADLRNGPDVARLAACFLPGSGGAAYLRSQAAVLPPDSRRIPVLYRAVDMDDEWDFLAGLVRQEVERLKRVGILVPVRYLVYRIHNELAARGVDVVKVEKYKLAGVDFNNLSPKLMTIHSAKGLTFDTVVLPHLTRRWYYGKEERESKRPVAQLLFVACTRAREWVAMSTVESWSIPELKALESLVPEGGLILKSPDGQARAVDQPSDPGDFVPL